MSDPKLTLSKGYAIVRQDDRIITRKSLFSKDYETEIEFYDGRIKING